MLYQRALQIDRRRIRSWNNLAMVLSEIPGREADAIAPIERALQLVGEDPELLDTKAVVLTRAGRIEEAKLELDKAIKLSDDPRYHFHLVVALLAQNREAEARRHWASIDLEALGPNGLMAEELVTVQQLKQRFGSAAEDNN